MQKTDSLYQRYLAILNEELISATGCTEPISIALAAAKAKEVLGETPDRIVIAVSEYMMKNAKSVVVPNTDNLKGIKVAVSAGIIVGQSVKQLDVIAAVSKAECAEIKRYLKATDITLKTLNSEYVLDVQITVYHQNESAKVRIINHHTNIVLIEKNADTILAKDYVEDDPVADDAKTALTVKDIVDFADSVEIDDVKVLLDNLIKNNSALAEMGLSESFGANIGSVLMNAYGDSVHTRAKAKAAAASDARMSGCKMPVTIVSGSGNQGITASLPIIEYAKEWSVSKERLYRALVLSNLITIHQKTGVGKLSAYCGVVFAGAGSGAGITYLSGGGYEAIAHTIVNTLAIISGMICDGAKPSCAAKIASSVEAGILAHHMVIAGEEFLGGDGIIVKGIENTIRNVSRLAKEGMRITDQEIIKMMTENDTSK